MEEQKLNEEELACKVHEEQHKQLLEKITKASKEISEILDRDGLMLIVNHKIAIVPRQ